MQIAENTVVTIHYTLTDVEGKVLDSSIGEEPLSYLHGSGSIVPGLEKALVGKGAGDEIKVTIAPDEAYGQREEDMVQKIPRSEFPEGDIEVGMQFRAQGAHGSHILSVIALDNDTVTMDGNHPLAGATLKFDVKVVSVREAGPDDLHSHHGHHHGDGEHGGGCGSCGSCGGH
jgi:FKBP-type peptidyl-prolyl cis-trans isomerase SlyD